MREENKCELSLLERLADRARCGYISDLKGLGESERRRLARELEQISAEAVSLSEWNDALAYLINGEKAKDRETARAALISSLAK